MTKPAQPRVVEDMHASADYRYRASIGHKTLAPVIVRAATPEQAADKARARHQLRLLGVDSVGLAIPDESTNPEAGEIATNGYRYALWRQVGPGPRIVHWIMLNPSQADAEHDDATMRRVCGYAKSWGYGWVTVGHLWPYRTTEPADLMAWLNAGGEWVARSIAESDRWVSTMAQRADLVIIAWGTHGATDRRAQSVLAMLAEHGIEPNALALTRDGQPRHPARLSASLTPRPYHHLRTLLASAGEP